MRVKFPPASRHSDPSEALYRSLGWQLAGRHPRLRGPHGRPVRAVWPSAPARECLTGRSSTAPLDDELNTIGCGLRGTECVSIAADRIDHEGHR